MNYLTTTETSHEFANALAEIQQKTTALPAVITSANDAIAATAIVAEANGLIKAIEKQHKELKAPYLEASRKLDGLKKNAVAQIDAVKSEVNDRIVAYQREQQRIAEEARKRAEEEAQRIALEAAKQRQSLNPVDQIAHEAATDVVVAQEVNNIIANSGAAPVAGTRISRKVEIASVNIAVLAKMRPDMCKIEADLTKIKAAILMGETIPGVVATIKETASVRAVTINSADYDY